MVFATALQIYSILLFALYYAYIFERFYALNKCWLIKYSANHDDLLRKLLQIWAEI